MGADSPGGQSSSDRSARCEGGSYPDTASAAARAADRAEMPPGPTPRRGNATVPRSPSTSARVAARPVVDGDSTSSTCAWGDVRARGRRRSPRRRRTRTCTRGRGPGTIRRRTRAERRRARRRGTPRRRRGTGDGPPRRRRRVATARGRRRRRRVGRARRTVRRGATSASGVRWSSMRYAIVGSPRWWPRTRLWVG